MAYPHKREKIAATVRKWLQQGKYRPGDRFPSDLELAQRFKVTHVTVRGALKPMVDDGTLERRIGHGTIVRAATDNGMVSFLAGAVGVLIPDNTHSFFGEVLKGIESELSATRRPLLLAHTEEMGDREEAAVNRWIEQGITHLILVPTITRASHYRKIVERGIKLVFVDRMVPGMDVPSVRSRDVDGSQRLTAHLLGLGHRRIFLLAGPTHASTAKARVEGFRAAMKAANAPFDEKQVVPAGFFAEDGHRAVMGLLALEGRPDAIVASNDAVALGALRALAAAKLEVPAHVSLAGYGDTDLAKSFEMTTVRQFPERMGREAVRILMGDAALTAAASIEIEPELIVRGSTAVRA